MAIFALIKPQKTFFFVDRIMKFQRLIDNYQFDDQNWKDSFKFSLRLKFYNLQKVEKNIGNIKKIVTSKNLSPILTVFCVVVFVELKSFNSFTHIIIFIC